MADPRYEQFRALVNNFTIPACILSVKKDEKGLCSDARFFVVNEVFKKSYLETFKAGENADSLDSDAVAKMVEGTLYHDHMPKDLKFESLLIEAAWKKKNIHTYVDTTKMYGYWTEDIIFPVELKDDKTVKEPDTEFCLFMYTLNKDMDTGKYASVSPDISSFVIKACLELRNEKDFILSMNTVTEDIRDYTRAFRAAVLTYDKDQRNYDVIAESHAKSAATVKENFSDIPFDILEVWEELLKGTNCIIIENESDMAHYEKLAPKWVKTMRDNDVKSLCLMPFIHQELIIGFLYIKNFDTSETTRIKETLELVSFFLAAEVANHLFLEKLEYLSNVDMLTGVYNRNCMNVNVDELAIKLKLNPRPFNVAFFDLNGLKSINDNGGHNKGDQLLIESAEVLKDIYKKDKIYRAGGDEFVVISFDSKENFEAKIEETRKRASDPNWIYFAIGYYRDESKGKLRLAMRYADEAMYKDKNAFYEAHPEKRR